jgi:hypothetical protein
VIRLSTVNCPATESVRRVLRAFGLRARGWLVAPLERKVKPSATSTISRRINISLLSLTPIDQPRSDGRTLKKQVHCQMHKPSVSLLITA